MSLHTVLKTVFCFAALMMSSQAQASVINFNSYDLDMGKVAADQSGRIDRFASGITQQGYVKGLLPPNTRITFTYHPGIAISPNNYVKKMSAVGSYDYQNPTNAMLQSGNSRSQYIGDAFGGSYDLLSEYFENDILISDQPEVKANVNHLTLTAIIENTSRATAFFSSFIHNAHGAGVFGYASYQVSSVPLPAALPLFGMGLLALGARRKFRKEKSC